MEWNILEWKGMEYNKYILLYSKEKRENGVQYRRPQCDQIRSDPIRSDRNEKRENGAEYI